MRMKTYPERARAAALLEIEEDGGQKTFGAATENNSLDLLRRMKDEGLIAQTNNSTPGEHPIYRTAQEEAETHPESAPSDSAVTTGEVN